MVTGLLFSREPYTSVFVLYQTLIVGPFGALRAARWSRNTRLVRNRPRWSESGSKHRFRRKVWDQHWGGLRCETWSPNDKCPSLEGSDQGKQQRERYFDIFPCHHHRHRHSDRTDIIQRVEHCKMLISRWQEEERLAIKVAAARRRARMYM